ncbi:MAG: M61 family metallopeptidase [Phycisphaeraceae bacterium]|nr:M61 family metallopeptidase [Phycisphaeraceae bacterium]
MPSVIHVGAVVAAALLAVAACAMQAGGPRTPSGAGGGSPRIRYTVSLPDPQTQMIDVRMTIEGVDAPALDLALPVWRPGKYLVLDPAGGIRGMSATGADGRSLPVEKTDKATWRITTEGSHAVIASYRVYANALGDRTRHVDDTHAFISPSTVLMYVPDRRGEPVAVRIEAPGGWQVATGLDAVPGMPHEYAAPDYDTLVDSPLEIGRFQRIDFEVDSVPHEIVVWTGRGGGDGASVRDPERLARDFAAIVRAQRDIFGDLPYARYVYIIHLTAGASGGTEHLNSFVAQGPRNALDDPKAYDKFLGLISHEMFHTWNVKRLRPADLTPYDYAHENYTKLLWVAEGTTSYYDDLCLVRAGIIKPDDYLALLQRAIAAEADRPGAAEQSLEESSFDAWIKFNRPDPDAVNSTVSFYGKGALASLYLDLLVRERTDGRVSLDDVMRDLYRRHPLGSAGYTTADVLAALNELTGSDMAPVLRDHIAGRQPMDFAAHTGVVGLELVFEPEKKDGEPLPPAAYLGLNLAEKSGRTVVQSIPSDGPAYAAGVNADDEIVALNGVRLGANDLAGRLKPLRPGEVVRLTVLRRDALKEIPVTLASKPAGSWKLRRVEHPSDQQRAQYSSWLGQGWPGPAAEAKADSN